MVLIDALSTLNLHHSVGDIRERKSDEVNTGLYKADLLKYNTNLYLQFDSLLMQPPSGHLYKTVRWRKKSVLSSFILI